MPLNLNSRLKTLALRLVLLETFSVKVNHRLPTTRWMFHPDFSQLTPHFFYRCIFTEEYCLEAQGCMPVFDRIFLLSCKVLCHLLTHLSQPNLPSLWTSIMWLMWFFYLVKFFERPFCDESSVNTKCSISRRNNVAWFSTESHFSFFHFSLCLSLSLLHYSTDPFIKRQRQKMLWLFPSALCQWMLLLTAQLTAADRSSILICILGSFTCLVLSTKLVCSFLPANFHKILRFLLCQSWIKLARR